MTECITIPLKRYPHKMARFTLATVMVFMALVREYIAVGGAIKTGERDFDTIVVTCDKAH